MRGIIKYFLVNPIAGNMLMFFLFIMGILSLFSIKSTFFPEVESRIITIRAIYPGASPEEIEEGIVSKIEENLKGITGIERTSSVSSENLGLITVETFSGFDIDVVLRDVKNAVDQTPSFPVSMEPPIIAKQESRSPAISFSLSGDVGLKTLKAFARDVETDLLAMDGISKIELTGFPEEEIEIAFRESDMRIYNLTFDEAVLAIRGTNLISTGGTIKSDQEELLIRANNRQYTGAGFRDVIVRTNPNGGVIKLHQIADIKDQWEDSPKRTYVNSDPSVVVSVSSTIQEDLLDISTKVKAYIEEFNEENNDISATIIADNAKYLLGRINLLAENGYLGFFIVILLLAVFLNWRLAFWVALAIPISFCGMFLLVPLTGITINIMSVFGMILVIGILVDDGIVIAENIYQKYEEGLPATEAALEGTMEVLPAVFSAILTTVIAFTAFLFVEGRLGDFFGQVAIVVILCLIFSLVEGAFILPAHIAHSKALTKRVRPALVVSAASGISQVCELLKVSRSEFLSSNLARDMISDDNEHIDDQLENYIKEVYDYDVEFLDDDSNKAAYIAKPKKNPIMMGLNNIMDVLRNYTYKPVLKFAMNYSIPTVALGIAMMAVTAGAFNGGYIRNTFFPSIPFDAFSVTLELPAGTNAATTKRILDHIEASAFEVNKEYNEEHYDDGKEIFEKIQKNVGPSINEGSLAITLLGGEERGEITARDLISILRKKVGPVYEAESLQYVIRGPFGSAASISLQSQDYEQLDNAVDEVEAAMSNISDLKDVTSNNKAGLKEVSLELTPKAYNLGLTLSDIVRQVRQGFFGGEVQRLQRGEDEVKVWVRYKIEDRSDISKLSDMRIRTAGNLTVPLSELATFSIERGVTNINHLNGRREIRIEADVANNNVSVADITTELQTQIVPEILAKYPSVDVLFEGEKREQEKTTNSLQTTLAIIFMLMFFVIVLTFKSVSQAMIVFAIIPFCFIGVGLGHFVMERPISLLSGLGIIALIGVLINDALVFITTFNQKIGAGKTFNDALYETGMSRFRPIVLTSVTTIAGLLPLLLEKSLNAQFLIPMAISVAFGLMIVTFIILALTPALLVISNNIKVGMLQIWEGHTIKKASVEPAYAGAKKNYLLFMIGAVFTGVGLIILVSITGWITGLLF